MSDISYKVTVLLLGKLYEQYRNALQWEERKGNIEVLAIGTPSPYAESLDGWRMTDIDNALLSGFDYLIMAQPIHETAEAAKTFAKIGIDPYSVLSIEVFGAICFDFAAYIRLHHSKVSIIAGNCWGGFTYHALKLPFYSPFINMFLEDDDYLRLVLDLDGYLAEPLRQDMSEQAEHYAYPLGLLGDVRLHLNHYPNFETAREQWEKRLARLNRENLFFMMFTCRREVAQRFAELTYDRKVVFTPDDFGVDCQINLGCFNSLIGNNMNEFFKSVNSVAGGALQFYDPIRLLNGEKEYYRV